MTFGKTNKTKIYNSDLNLTDEEKQQIQQIKQISENHNIQLCNKAEEDLSIRQNRRNAINLDGGVFVKDVKLQNVGKSFIGYNCEVLHIVKI